MEVYSQLLCMFQSMSCTVFIYMCAALLYCVFRADWFTLNANCIASLQVF